jgi:hypothetical protein
MLRLLYFRLEECECNTIPVQNTLRTRVKQIRNPKKEISGGFLLNNS